MTAKREKTIEEIIRKLKDVRDEYPITYSDKVEAEREVK